MGLEQRASLLKLLMPVEDNIISLVGASTLGIECAVLHFTHPLTAKAARKLNSSIHCLLNSSHINATWYPGVQETSFQVQSVSQ